MMKHFLCCAISTKKEQIIRKNSMQIIDNFPRSRMFNNNSNNNSKNKTSTTPQ